MHGISLFTGVALIASLVLGASGLVMNPVVNAPHKRHAAAVVNVGRDVTPVAMPLMPRQTISERRALRQKRCLNNHVVGSTMPSPAANVDNNNNAPANVAPAPTPTPDSTTPTNDVEQQAQPSPQPAANTPSNSGSSGADTFSGQLTFYDVGLGACGFTNSNSDMIAAASMLLYDGFDGYTGGNPNNNPICGKQASITYQGRTIVVTIVDRCVGCAKYDLDLAPAAFNQLADPGLGRLDGMTWHFL